MILVLMSPMSVYAMSQQNIIAQQALKKQLIADKRQYCNWVMDKINMRMRTYVFFQSRIPQEWEFVAMKEVIFIRNNLSRIYQNKDV